MSETIDFQSLCETIVRKQACFAKLTDEEITVLASLFEEKHFAAGETIVHEGDPVDSFYLILSGTADVRKHNLDKTESIATLRASSGDAIGLNDTGFYSLTGLRTATVVALTDMSALYLSIAIFHGFSLNYHHVNEVMHEQSMKFIKK